MFKSKNSLRDSSYWDRRFSWASASFFICSVANASIKTILPIPKSLWPILSIISGVIILSFYIANFKAMYRRSFDIFWRSYILFTIIYLFSAILILIREEPLDLMLTQTAFLTMVWWIPSGLYACSVKDKEILYDTWVKASYIISAFSILMFFFHIPSEIETGSADYNIAFGYYIILPLLIQINEFSKKRKLLLLLLILFEIFTIVVYASRGILLSLVFFAVYRFAFESKSRVKRVLSVLILLLFGFIMIASVETIAQTLVNLLDKFGYESRTLDLLASGMVSDTSGRDTIWSICYKLIEKYPITGMGLGGEYYQLGYYLENASRDSVTADAFNPHNGIIQNFVSFGVIGGFIVTIIVLFPLLRMKKNKDRAHHELLVIFYSAAIIPLCISTAGFFVKPAVAICLYLFYFRSRNNSHNFKKTFISP